MKLSGVTRRYELSNRKKEKPVRKNIATVPSGSFFLSKMVAIAASVSAASISYSCVGCTGCTSMKLPFADI